MCITLWRRYFCPKAPNLLQLPDSGNFVATHPRPKPAVPNHHLLSEDDGVYRENAHDPSDNVPDGKHIHWIKNLIRCSHIYARQCADLSSDMIKIQYINSVCPNCSGDIDIHVEDHDLILEEFDIHPRIPTENERDVALDVRFEGYKEYYLLHLLQLVMWVLYKPYPMPGQGVAWTNAISNVWPETFCKLRMSHIGHEEEDCDCVSTLEEWRANLAYSIRKNEAKAVLNHINNIPNGEISQFWSSPILVQVADGVITEDWRLSQRALEIYNRYEDVDFPLRQMEFVNLRNEVYGRRLSRLYHLSEQCHIELLQRGQATSQQYPANAAYMTRRIHWLGLDNWRDSLARRHLLLDWLYQFLACDAGLDEEVMMYLGGALLAILNPWPNRQHYPHPSHPQPQAFDPDLAACDVLQECVYLIEEQWPLDGNSAIMRNLTRSTTSTAQLADVIDRNRRIVIRDITERNRSADAKSQALIATPEQANQEGDHQCAVCQMPWDHAPCHEPVQMPCCRKYIGRRCLKKWLAQKPLRRALADQPETDVTWAAEWNCLLCRGQIGPHFSPNLNLGSLFGPSSIRHITFHSRMEPQPRPPQYWDHMRRLQEENGAEGQSQ
ncbi:uncharacterized protein CTRU02_205271 [Colletotrichum truncatum]|uniref:Uncharacterized protein n=1 Tax=Colletotrichum truncatum TaxID=5467 RepID=A0ACC3Z3I6_COLTU|nr:uncharacterized protein CTRU02_04328 [Colletotrichum truncatum]KAF6795518.1 hypothetical protein CTRU02_04328 [Colletotrichum truncatum]